MKIQQMLSPASSFAVIRLSTLYSDRLEGLVNYNGSVVHCSATRTANGNIVWTYDPSRRVAIESVRELNNALCLDGHRYRLIPRNAIGMYIDNVQPPKPSYADVVAESFLSKLLSMFGLKARAA